MTTELQLGACIHERSLKALQHSVRVPPSFSGCYLGLKSACTTAAEYILVTSSSSAGLFCT
jgi:hypothetical protein